MGVANDFRAEGRSGGFLRFIAYLQIIGIILVVLGHSFHEYPDGNQGKSMLLYRMLFSFRMPLFMFVSGYLMVYTTRIRRMTPPSVASFAKGKVTRLLIPFVVLTAVTFIPRTLMSGMADEKVSMSMGSLLASFIDARSLVIPYFWFLQASFLLLVFTYILISLGERFKVRNGFIYGCMILFFLFLPYFPVSFTSVFAVNEVARLGVYFVLGASYARFAYAIDRVIPWARWWFLAPVIAIWGLLFFLTEDTPFVLFCSLAGICMCISVAKILEVREARFLDHLIGANYIIFLLSWYCNVISQQVLAHFLTLPWWVHTLLSLVSGVYIPWMCYRYLLAHPKSRWVRATAFLLGQSLKKK